MNDIMEDCISDIIFEVAIEVKWLIKTMQWTIDDVYDTKPIPLEGYVQPQIANVLDSSNHAEVPSSSFPPSLYELRPILCNVCGKEVAGNRFAPHLERCMHGGSRGGRRLFDALDYDFKGKVKKEFEDPYPLSLVIKIKMRNGVPITKNRVGVPYEKFLQHSNGPS